MKPGKSMDHGGRLYEALLTLNTPEECRDFLSDLCTHAELNALEQRLHVAMLLGQGRVYTDIMKATGASSATISRVSHAMNYGPGGYKTVIERLDK